MHIILCAVPLHEGVSDVVPVEKKSEIVSFTLCILTIPGHLCLMYNYNIYIYIYI